MKNWQWKRPWCWERLKARGERDKKRIRWLDGIIDSMDMNLSKLWELLMGEEAWPMGLQSVGRDWATELNKTERKQGSHQCPWPLLDHIVFIYMMDPWTVSTSRMNMMYKHRCVASFSLWLLPLLNSWSINCRNLCCSLKRKISWRDHLATWCQVNSKTVSKIKS